MNQNWQELSHRGLQVAAASTIVSAALSHGAVASIRAADSDFTIVTAVASWLLLGLICWAPLAANLVRRLPRLLTSPTADEVWKARGATVFSVAAGVSWWFAPALLQAQ